MLDVDFFYIEFNPVGTKYEGADKKLLSLIFFSVGISRNQVTTLDLAINVKCHLFLQTLVFIMFTDVILSFCGVFLLLCSFFWGGLIYVTAKFR